VNSIQEAWTLETLAKSTLTVILYFLGQALVRGVNRVPEPRH
jgi:hypothetical protein